MLKKFKFDPGKFKIGMRTFKSGLAVFIVILLFNAFGISDGVQIAALAAVFSLREDFDKSIDFGTSRILSNSIGGFYALLYFILQDWLQERFWITLIFIPIFAMLTIMTNVAINNTAGVISGVATMLIIALSIPAGDSILYALTRVFQTFIGVFVAILVNADIKLIEKKE
ncbi:FUSC family protein [Streptococcus cameli]